jgi:hypothetical protein
MMGWFSSTAAIARMTIPIGAAYAYTYIGPNYIFITVALMVFLSNIFAIIVYPVIMPMGQSAEAEEAEEVRRGLLFCFLYRFLLSLSFFFSRAFKLCTRPNVLEYTYSGYRRAILYWNHQYRILNSVSNILIECLSL